MRGAACAIAFVLSSGYLFSSHKKNEVLNALAAALALASGVFAVKDTIDLIFHANVFSAFFSSVVDGGR